MNQTVQIQMKKIYKRTAILMKKKKKLMKIITTSMTMMMMMKIVLIELNKSIKKNIVSIFSFKKKKKNS